MSANNLNTTRRLWTPARMALTFLALFLVAMMGVSSCKSNDELSNSNRVTVTASPAITNSPAAPVTALPSLPANVLNAELKSVNGPPIRLGSYAGKVLIVNLWATWCGPCRVEVPELVKLYHEYRPKGVEVVGLSTEDPDASAEAVKTFVQDYKVDYRVGWAGRDVALTLMQGNDAIPQSFVISRDGHLVRRFVGFNMNATPPQIRLAIEEALKKG